VLDEFIIDFFSLKDEAEALKHSNETEREILKVRSDFVIKRILKKYKETDLVQMNFPELTEQVNVIKETMYSHYDWVNDEEKATAFMIRDLADMEQHFRNHLEVMPGGFVYDKNIEKTASEGYEKLKDFTGNLTLLEYKNTEASQEQKIIYEYLKHILEIIQKWCYARLHDKKEGRKVKHWALFWQPMNLNYNDLVHNKEEEPGIPEKFFGEPHSLRRRDGFALTDHRYGNRMVMSEVEYCVFCHERNKDSCTKGLHEKDGAVKRNPLGIKLNGCPLDEKISEMHYLKYEGRSIGALGIIMIDNPMLPGTGHRICNDCMKGCIYQKQEPVNIPQIETRVLTEVLYLPYGCEIYSLLTRWNPLYV
jgi:hypothetical protein